MADLAKLQAPEGSTSVSWAQKEYEVVKGFVMIEVEAVEELAAHGFSRVFGKGKKDEAAADQTKAAE